MDEDSCLRPSDDGEPSVLGGQLLLRVQDAVRETVSQLRQRIAQSFAVSSVVFFLFWISTFLYWSFYNSYMPSGRIFAPVHFYLRTGCESPASFLCSYPVANISMMRNKKNVLTLGQAYQISVLLEMPESPANQDQGMFMIRTTCFSADGGQLASSAHSESQLLSGSSSRFTMLRYRSGLLRNLEMLLFLPAFLGGAAEQKQMLEVELFSDFTNSPFAPVTSVVVEILSNKVEIYSSQLRIQAILTGIRYLMFNFPLLSAAVGVCINFTFLSLLFGLGYLRLLLTAISAPKKRRTDGLLAERENNVNNNHQRDEIDTVSSADNVPEPGKPTFALWLQHRAQQQDIKMKI